MVELLEKKDLKSWNLYMALSRLTKETLIGSLEIKNNSLYHGENNCLIDQQIKMRPPTQEFKELNVHNFPCQRFKVLISQHKNNVSMILLLTKSIMILNRWTQLYSPALQNLSNKTTDLVQGNVVQVSYEIKEHCYETSYQTK